MTSANTESTAPARMPTRVLALRWRLLVSVLVVLHLAAVFVPPFRFASRSPQGEASPLADIAYRAMRPYINAAYLDHGYFYFAPNPGPSHLVRYEIDQGEGRAPIKGVFPHIEPSRPRLIGTQLPRLMYHRHFMLAESLHANFTPPEPPEELPENEELRRAVLDDWRRRREMYVTLKTSLEEHLSAAHAGRPVKIVRLEHRQPTPAEFGEGIKINDERLYRDLPETIVETVPAGGAQ